jgi:ferrous iron transport protein A
MLWKEAGLDFQMQLGGTAMIAQKVEITAFRFLIRLNMQSGVKKNLRGVGAKSARNLTELKRGEHGVLERIDLPEEDARRLMEMGFLPGHTITPAHAAPGGDPRVFRVDGSEVALRRETAIRMILRTNSASEQKTPPEH